MLRTLLPIAALIFLLPSTLGAQIPIPDATVYGTIVLDGEPVTSGELVGRVIRQDRTPLEVPAVFIEDSGTSYYVLRIPLESSAGPVGTAGEAAREGDVLAELILDGTVVRRPSLLLAPGLVGEVGESPATFIRGDVDGNGVVNITDPINNLSFQFLGTFHPPCMDAADTDDSGVIDISDPINSLSFQFLGTFDIPLPGPTTCGPDPTPDLPPGGGDDLGCIKSFCNAGKSARAGQRELSLSQPPLETSGGWATQTFSLKGGWNMIWFDVDPVPADPATVAATIDCDSIWSFVPGRASGDRGAWVVYFKGGPYFLNSLHELQGKRGYAVKMLSAGTLSLTGRSVNRGYYFSRQAPNLFGASVLPANAPSFAEFFSFPGIADKVKAIHEWDGDSVTSVPLSKAIAENAAVWVSFSQDMSYQGPIQVIGSPDGLQFGTTGYTDTLTVDVPVKVSPQTITVKVQASGVPPAGQPVDATSPGNENWLEYRGSQGEWVPFPPGGATITVPAGEARGELEFRCVRAGRDPATVAAGGTQGAAAKRSGDGRGAANGPDPGGQYQALLEIADMQGNSVLLGAGMEVLPPEGLWIGQARLNKVSVQSGVPNPSASEDAPSLSMALILEIPGAGPPRLLDRACIEQDRDGRRLKYRYNAILFHEPVELSGSVDANGTAGTLTGSITMAADHPLNPYRHRYHPEHQVGYDFTRQITLSFSDTDQDPVSQALGTDENAGENEIVGTYTEVISGLSLEPITVRGFFKLHRRSATAPVSGCE